MNSIVWLASYPKSGNTWLRVLLANYIRGADEPVDINGLDESSTIASSRRAFDRWAGVEASALDQATVDLLRPHLYRQMSLDADCRLFLKVHDAWARNARGEGLFPADATAMVVYIVRDPLDVAVSTAAYWGIDSERAVRRMCDPNACLCDSEHRLHEQLRQWTGSWSHHVCSWVDRSALPCHVVRYEDLRSDPEAAFGALVEACGLERSPARVRSAIAFSDFTELRRQEAARGFRERPAHTRGTFFRSGRVGAWHNELTDGQVAQIRAEHGPTMRRFGYLQPEG